MDGNIAQLLENLKLRRIAKILDEEAARAIKSEPSYEEFLVRLLREEWRDQQDRATQARIRRAKIREPWVLETFPYGEQPSVKKKTIEQLARLDFMSRSENIVFIGESGVGKTGLAIGLLRKAIEAGHRGLFIKAQDLFDEMYSTLADRTTRRFLNRLSRIDLLVIDEMGYLNVKPEQANIFFKLMDERYRRRPTIITTNLEFKRWYDFLGNKDLVRALLDRLRQFCVQIDITGPSLRGGADKA